MPLSYWDTDHHQQEDVGALPTISKILKGVLFSKQRFSTSLAEQFRRAPGDRSRVIRASGRSRGSLAVCANDLPEGKGAH